ncbi:MAG TPA: VOC family protein [Pirellulales bacterium]|jgi:lactoylglutathione lyase|nr:VOC family protein [Pirellulales bacterium]
MITGLFETHINVADLERSVTFYRNVLGLELAHSQPSRHVCFFWMGDRGAAMLGVWETPREQVQRQHFAFQASVEDVRDSAVPWLRERGLRPYNFLDDGSERPMVFAWMPAISIYFDDPDGHLLEMIAMLEGTPRPELGVISWEEWQRINA